MIKNDGAFFQILSEMFIGLFVINHQNIKRFSLSPLPNKSLETTPIFLLPE
jgi:hypothetical protein